VNQGRPQVSDHVGEVLDLLWPDEPADDATSVSSLVALPNAENPRLVIPRRPRAASAAAVRHYKTSATGRTRWLARGGALAVRAGLADLLPGRIDLPAGSADIRHHLREVLGSDVQVALYVGPRRAVEKPVLQVLSPSGEVLAYAKLGTGTLTRSLVHTEVSALRELSSQRFTALEVPSLLHTGTWHGHDLIVQEAVTDTSGRTPGAALVAAAIDDLAWFRGGSAAGPWATSGYRADLIARVEALGPSPHRPALRQGLALLDRRHSLTPVRLGESHGDWAPWNMAQRHGRLVVWDWEHLASGVPVGFDAVHHDFSRQVVLDGVEIVDAVQRLLAGRDAAVTDHFATDGDRSLLVTAYLLDLATRYVETGEVVVGGTTTSRLEDWLVPALAQCAQALEGPSA
jgi:hypothetical protein